MTFGEAINSCLDKYATFRGRASPSEYWWWFLFHMLVLIAAMIVDRLIGTTFPITNPATGVHQNMPYGFVYAFAALGLLLPGLSVLVRRLHDRGRSGWWYWIVLVPLVGVCLLLYWLVAPGDAGGNRYGYDTRTGDLAEAFR